MTQFRNWATVVVVLLAVILLVACSTENPAPVVTDPTLAPAATPTPLPEPTSLPDPTNTPTPPAEPDPTVSSEQEPEAMPAAKVEPESTIEEQSVVEKVIAAFPDPPQTDDQVVLLYGYVLDTDSNPIPNAAVEIWQTDADGYYDHPRDPSTENRDTNFQFFGTSVADETGLYFFRTISPGYYEPRPKHIHVKVKIDGRVTLITQFYFDEDRPNLANEGLFSQAGDQGERLILETVGSGEMNGNVVTILTNDLVIDSGSGGSLTPTPVQGEGPYYPLVDVAEYDEDLTVK